MAGGTWGSGGNGGVGGGGGNVGMGEGGNLSNGGGDRGLVAALGLNTLGIVYIAYHTLLSFLYLQLRRCSGKKTVHELDKRWHVITWS